jgi:hypothetical protein
MASINWPSNIPSGFLAEGFSKTPKSNVIRSSMDAGPQKTRRRYTARTINYTGREIFDTEELALFEQFYHTALADGALRFNYADPITGEVAEFRFTKDYTVSTNNGLFEVTLNLEKL